MGKLEYDQMDAVERSMEDLNKELSRITRDFANAENSVYYFSFTEVDPPEEADIAEQIDDPEQFIRETVDSCIYGWGGALSPRFNDAVLDHMIDIIIRTLNSHAAELYDLYLGGWEKYGYGDINYRPPWMGLIQCLVRLRGERDHWYIFWFSWSD